MLAAGEREFETVRERAQHRFERTETPANRVDDPVRPSAGGVQRRVRMHSGQGLGRRQAPKRSLEL